MNLTQENLISLLRSQNRVKQILEKKVALTDQEKENLASFFQISVDYF